MGPDLSHVTSSRRFPRLLIAESNLATAESLVHTFEDSRLDVDYDVCTSRQSAVIKLFRSPAPYNVIISSVHLAEIDDFLLLRHNRALQPSVPFVVTNRASETESSRRALAEGAFDLISIPPKQEEAVSTILLALWQSKLTTLIACKENALEKYRDHIAAYPSGNQMDETFKKTLSALANSILAFERSLLRTEECTVNFSDFATKVEQQARKRALERLDTLANIDKTSNLLASSSPREIAQPATKLLLVDPNDEQRQYWAQRLKMCSSDYSVIEAKNGKSALALWKSERIDCVVLELDLPDMSGFGVLVQLVPRVSQPEVPVVVLTRLMPPALAELATRNGAQATLMKQRISGEDLDQAIRKAIAVIGPKKQEAPLASS